ncbi:MAG: ATP-dependent helicase HrpB, partial [Pseudomonadota bacterium]
PAVVRAVHRALKDYDGSVLVFLPGRAEIERVAAQLHSVQSEAVFVAPLFGAMDMRDQAKAVAPPAPGQRKIVLATSIAQTSITIDGVRVVIDTGLSREPVFEPAHAITRLETVRVSQATADQRAGRAGRTEPGIAIRLWHEGQTRSLRPHDVPEILRTDLSRFYLDALAWGARNPSDLPLLDAPPPGALAEARKRLQTLGLCDEKLGLTTQGASVRAIALPVALAASVSCAQTREDATLRALVGLCVTDIAPRSREIDLDAILRDLLGARSGHHRNDGHLIAQAKRIATNLDLPGKAQIKVLAASAGPALLDAYPDRVAKRRGAEPGTFLMANGRAAQLAEDHPLASEAFLVVADLTGRAAAPRITAAAAITEAQIRERLGHIITEVSAINEKPDGGGLEGFEETRLGALILSRRPLTINPGPALTAALGDNVRRKGIGVLPFTDEHRRLISRMQWLHVNADAETWPDMSDETLAAEAEAWLAPYLVGKTTLKALTGQELTSALLMRVGASRTHEIDRLAPSSIPLPTGRNARLSYDASDQPPKLSVRVQELFGLKTHPAINNGKTPIVVEVLSPAQRPIQTTLDLAGFWSGSWADVRRDMRGRYPRHEWPQDPANATPTARAKTRK